MQASKTNRLGTLILELGFFFLYENVSLVVAAPAK